MQFCFDYFEKNTEKFDYCCYTSRKLVHFSGWGKCKRQGKPKVDPCPNLWILFVL